MENDPQYPCNVYEENGDYHKCLENDFVEQNLLLLNCTPPWMTENEELWCREKRTFGSKDNKTMFDNFIHSLSFGSAVSKCPVPCLAAEYQVKNIGFVQGEKTSFVINFDNTVKKTITGPQVTALSLVSKFGGIIGLGKNLLWIIILFWSSLKMLKIRPAK